MTIKSSGPISIGDINVELSLARATNKNLGNTAVRSLLNRASGAVPLSAAYGKSNIKNPFNLYAATSGNFHGADIYGTGIINNGQPVLIPPGYSKRITGINWIEGSNQILLFSEIYATPTINLVIDGAKYTLQYDGDDIAVSMYLATGINTNVLSDGWHNLGFF